MTNLRPLILVAAVVSGCGSTSSPSVDRSANPRLERGADEVETNEVDTDEIPGAAPIVSEITPAQASPGMEVTIRGAGFSTEPGETAVFFGVTPGEILSVTATEIRVHPAAPAPGTRGPISVEVVVRGRSSNGLFFQLSAAGDVIEVETGAHSFASDVVSLPSGEVLVIDADERRMFSIDTNGWIRPVASGLSAGADKLSMAPNGTVLVTGGEGLQIFDPATSQVTAFAAGGPWSAVIPAKTAYLALHADGSSIDQISAAGEVVGENWIPVSAGCSPAVDLTLAGGRVWVATESGTLCSALVGEAAELIEIPLVDVIYGIRALRTEDGQPSMLAYFSDYGWALATVDTEGASMVRAIVSTDASAFDVGPNGTYRVTSPSGQVLQIADATQVLAAPLAGITASAEVGGRLVVAGGIATYDLPFIAEVGTDGAVRVIGSHEDPQYWTSITGDESGILVASMFEGTILRIDAEGQVSTVADHSEFGSIASMLRLADGSFLVSDWTQVAKYDADGNFEGVIATLDGAAGMAVDDSELWVAAGSTLVRLPIAGGVVQTWIGTEARFTGLNAVVIGAETIFVSDESGAILAVRESGVEPIAQSGLVLGLVEDSHGRILVADTSNVPYRMLP